MAITRVGTVTPRFVSDTSIDIASVPANSTAAETYTVAGLQTDMVVYVNLVSDLTAGLLGPTNVYVSAANTLKMSWNNTTGGAINPAAQVLRIIGF